jgi:hypothetical protein
LFRHTDYLQFDAQPEKPDPVYAHKLQELIGGAFGEMTVTMQYLFQGWNCRMPGKYKDLIMDVATEEIGHVEMIATMVARLLEGAPATATTKAAAAGPCWPTATATRGTDATSWPAGTCWPISAPMSPPLGQAASAPPPDPALYATYDGSMGKPSGPAMGTEAGPIGKIKEKLT